MRLGFYVAALAAVGLFFTYTLPIWLYKCCKCQTIEQANGQVISGLTMTREPMLHFAWQPFLEDFHC